ncbi:putative zinc transporter msc2 [Xylographa opegraphella]|nr:putative zinc transporter msc2 [Xylographa opegraphella]
MATSYALPLNGAATHAHSHIGHGHTRSQHRKAVPERLGLAQAPANGIAPPNPGTLQKDCHSSGLRPHTHSQSLPQNSSGEPRETKVDHHHHYTAAQPHSQGAENSSSQAIHMDHGLSRSLAALPRLQAGYGDFNGDKDVPVSPDFANVESRRETITTLEAMSSMLIPLPFVLVSLVLCWQWPLQPVNLAHANLKSSVGLEGMETRASSSGHISRIIGLCALVSGTLLSAGLIGKWLGRTDTLDRRKRSHSSLGHRGATTKNGSNALSLENFRRVTHRILAVGLPIFGASTVGGPGPALILLVATVGDLANTEGSTSHVGGSGGWKRLLRLRKWTIAVISLQMIADLVGAIFHTMAMWPLVIGYMALAISVFVLPPPYLTPRIAASTITSPMSKSAEKTSAILTSWDPPQVRVKSFTGPRAPAPLISTAKDTNLTLVAGLLTSLPCAAWLTTTFSTTSPIAIVPLAAGIMICALSALSFTFACPRSMMTDKKIGSAVGLVLPIVLREMVEVQSWLMFAFQGVTAGLFWFALNIDTLAAQPAAYAASPHTHHHGSNIAKGPHSRFTGLLLPTLRNWPLLHSILMEKDSRRIFYFMCLNFGFMLVQTFYAIVTGSLGLLSDSIHMLFDCLALVVGLCAAVMSKWPPSVRFPYGFGKMDTLAGFANGVFLMLISVEIIYEAIERLVEGSQMQRLGELLTVSSLGLVVNLVGMFAFGHAHHGHGHSHGGHDHPHGDHDHSHGGHDHGHESHNHARTGHDHAQTGHGNSDNHCRSHTHAVPHLPPKEHEEHDHSGLNHVHVHQQSPLNQSHRRHSRAMSPTLTQSSVPPTPSSFSVPQTPSKPPPKHAHHHHGNENMHGIFLHVLADTLGSVAVVFSTILIHYTGWVGFDPLASCLIAILIFASAVPLVTSSAKRLLLAVPEDTEFDLREALAGVGSLKGVMGVQVPRFWMGEGEEGEVQGVMHVVVGRGSELDEVRQRAVKYLHERGMDVLVQVEREGEGRCWCGGAVIGVLNAVPTREAMAGKDV